MAQNKATYIVPDVQAGSVSDIDLGAIITSVDGVSLSDGYVILAKDQSDKSENGFYTWLQSTQKLSRNPQFLIRRGVIVNVVGGVANSGSIWILVTSDPIVAGVTNLSFVELLTSATAPAPVPPKHRSEKFAAASFSFSAGTSTISISDPISFVSDDLSYTQLMRNGIEDTVRVTPSPSTSGEYRVVGTTLEIAGDVTGSGDTYTLRYVAN